MPSHSIVPSVSVWCCMFVRGCVWYVLKNLTPILTRLFSGLTKSGPTRKRRGYTKRGKIALIHQPNPIFSEIFLENAQPLFNYAMHQINFHKILKPIPLFLVGCLSGFLIFTASSSTESEKKKAEFIKGYEVHPVPVPEMMEFAGEDIPMDDQELLERIDREFLVNTYWQSNTLLWMKRSKRAFDMIEPILKEQGVPEDFKYLAVIESGLIPVISPAGAQGVWQLMPATAKQYGLEVNEYVDERYHLEKSTLAACTFLKEAKNRFGSWTMAAAAYNMGISGLEKQSQNQNTRNYFSLRLNPETSRYLPRILAAKYLLSQPEEFGYQINASDYYRQIPFSVVEIDTSISDLNAFSQQMGMTYKTMRTLNPWLHQMKLPNAGSKKYLIKIARKE